MNHNNLVLNSPLNLKLQGVKFWIDRSLQDNTRSNPAKGEIADCHFVASKAKHQKELNINQGQSVQSLLGTNT